MLHLAAKAIFFVTLFATFDARPSRKCTLCISTKPISRYASRLVDADDKGEHQREILPVATINSMWTLTHPKKIITKNISKCFSCLKQLLSNFSFIFIYKINSPIL